MYTPAINSPVLRSVINNMDYVPIVSTAKSLAHIIQKVFYNSSDKLLLPSPHVFKPLTRENTGYSRDLLLLVPVFGNFVIQIWDAIARARGNRLCTNAYNALDDHQYISELQEASGYGIGEAMQRLGDHLMERSKCVKDERNAVLWYRQAARSGNIEALNSLGSCYERGIVCDKNLHEAFRLYSLAAVKGHEGATKNVLRLLPRIPPALAITPKVNDVLRALARLGNDVAMETLGERYALNSQVNSNSKTVKKAADWLEKAFIKGNKNAKKNLIDLSHTPVAIKCYPFALQKSLKTLAHKHASAMIARGDLIEAHEASLSIEPSEKKIEWYRKAARYGGPSIQEKVGKLFLSKNDPSLDKEAVNLFLNILQRDAIPAIDNLIVCMNKGKGMQRDEQEARALATEWEKHINEIRKFLAKIQTHPSDPQTTKQLIECIGGIFRKEKDIALYRKFAAGPHRSKVAMRALGNTYMPGGPNCYKLDALFEAIRWFSQGGCFYELGMAYQERNEEGDNQQAVQAFEKGATTGDLDAKYALAQCLLKDNETTKSLNRAKRLLKGLVKNIHFYQRSEAEELLRKHFRLTPDQHLVRHFRKAKKTSPILPLRLCRNLMHFSNKVKNSVARHMV